MLYELLARRRTFEVDLALARSSSATEAVLRLHAAEVRGRQPARQREPSLDAPAGRPLRPVPGVLDESYVD